MATFYNIFRLDPRYQVQGRHLGLSSSGRSQFAATNRVFHSLPCVLSGALHPRRVRQRTSNL